MPSYLLRSPSPPDPRRYPSTDSGQDQYNPHRRHSSLDYLSPVDFERCYAVVPPEVSLAA